MVGRRRKLDEKREGGLRGYNPTTSKKRSQSFSFSCASHIYHFLECRFGLKSVTVMMGRGFGRWWANCFQTFNLNASLFFHRLSSPFFGLVSAMLLALEKIAIGGHVGCKSFPIGEQRKPQFENLFLFFFLLSVFTCKSFPPPPRSGAS